MRHQQQRLVLPTSSAFETRDEILSRFGFSPNNSFGMEFAVATLTQVVGNLGLISGRVRRIDFDEVDEVVLRPVDQSEGVVGRSWICIERRTGRAAGRILPAGTTCFKNISTGPQARRERWAK